MSEGDGRRVFGGATSNGSPKSPCYYNPLTIGIGEPYAKDPARCSPHHPVRYDPAALLSPSRGTVVPATSPYGHLSSPAAEQRFAAAAAIAASVSPTACLTDAISALRNASMVRSGGPNAPNVVVHPSSSSAGHHHPSTMGGSGSPYAPHSMVARAAGAHGGHHLTNGTAAAQTLTGHHAVGGHHHHTAAAMDLGQGHHFLGGLASGDMASLFGHHHHHNAAIHSATSAAHHSSPHHEHLHTNASLLSSRVGLHGGGIASAAASNHLLGGGVASVTSSTASAILPDSYQGSSSVPPSANGHQNGGGVHQPPTPLTRIPPHLLPPPQGHGRPDLSTAEKIISEIVGEIRQEAEQSTPGPGAVFGPGGSVSPTSSRMPSGVGFGLMTHVHDSSEPGPSGSAGPVNLAGRGSVAGLMRLPTTYCTPGASAPLSKAGRKRGRPSRSASPGVKPFTCTYCAKGFYQKNQLLQHERIHTDERPYPCIYCDRRFKQQSHKMQHERIHTGEKPYICPICERRFRQKNHLDSHYRGHFGPSTSAGGRPGPGGAPLGVPGAPLLGPPPSTMVLNPSVIKDEPTSPGAEVITIPADEATEAAGVKSGLGGGGSNPPLGSNPPQNVPIGRTIPVTIQGDNSSDMVIVHESEPERGPEPENGRKCNEKEDRRNPESRNNSNDKQDCL